MSDVEDFNNEDELRKFANKLGIGMSIARELWDSNLKRYEQIATLTVKELRDIIDINKTLADKIINKARKISGMGFVPADILYEKRLKIDRITTGSNKLDGLLGGGVETGSITEFYGGSRSGKTQIAHQLAVNVQLSKDAGGLEAKALFIDTEGTFRPERIVSMALGMRLDPNKVLKNIYVARAFNSEHQISIIKNDVEELISQDNYRLLIIDSITSHFRAEYTGRESIFDRQQVLNKHLHQLERIAELYNCAVVITNQVMEDPNVIMGDPIKAAGGSILAHLSQTRIYLIVSRGNTRIARLVDSPVLPEGEVVFKLTNEGIVDV